MLLDCTSTPGPSVIEAAPNQLGPMGQRLILGPFRFVNHDCKPNSQVSFLLHLSIFDTFWVFFLTLPIQIFPIPDTHACVMATIQPIAANEEITIKYQQSGYYDQRCLCSSLLRSKGLKDATCVSWFGDNWDCLVGSPPETMDHVSSAVPVGYAV